VRPGNLRGRVSGASAQVADGGQERACRVLFPWGLAGRPGSGTIAAVWAPAFGEEAALPYRSGDAGLEPGDAAILSEHGSSVRCGDGIVEASDPVRATGFQVGQQSGVSGTLTVTDSDGWVLTIGIKGGIIVSVAATGAAVWAPEGS